jgi:GNAT superfamily N-acetyltransferase
VLSECRKHPPSRDPRSAHNREYGPHRPVRLARSRLKTRSRDAAPRRWQTERVPDKQALIRPARIDDDEQVWPLARDFATSFRPQRAAFDAAWAQLVGAPHTLLLVAETPDRGIVGYLLGNSHLTFLANGPVAWVEEVMVDGHTRHSGIGRRLMEHAEKWAQSIGAAYLALASRRAGPFYLALDYEDSAVFYKKTLT